MVLVEEFYSVRWEDITMIPGYCTTVSGDKVQATKPLVANTWVMGRNSE